MGDGGEGYLWLREGIYTIPCHELRGVRQHLVNVPPSARAAVGILERQERADFVACHEHVVNVLLGMRGTYTEAHTR